MELRQIQYFIQLYKDLRIVKHFTDIIYHGRKPEQIGKDFTRGHYKRGVE